MKKLILWLFVFALATPIFSQANNGNGTCNVSKCDDGWTHYKDTGKCLKVVTDIMDWDKAVTNCHSQNAELVTVHTAGESQFLDWMLRNTVTTRGWGFYMGANNIERGENLSWIDGSSMNFTNWAENQPIETDPRWPYPNCLGWDEEKWYSLACFKWHNSVCQKPENTCANGNSDGNSNGNCKDVSSCDEGWTKFEDGEKCLKVVNEYLSWDIASTNCHSQDAELVTVHSPSESQFLNEMLNRTDSYSGFFMGANNITRYGNKNWIDGSDMNFMNWRMDEPKETNDGYPLCLGVFGGKWMSLDCGKWHNSICQKPVSVTKSKC